jgi:hypothetical protein
MGKHKSFKQFFVVLILLASIVYSGCEKKAEKPNDEVKTEGAASDTSNNSSVDAVPEPVEETKITLIDITGKWTGTFDKRSTVFTITEQTDSSFAGKISINYREAINQEVKGTFSPTTMKMLMTDQLHSRFQGKYNGKLSEDGKSYSGTFTMDLDGSKFSFNLNKK